MCFLGNSAIMICSCKVEVHLPPAMSHKSSIYAVKHEMTSSGISLEGYHLSGLENQRSLNLIHFLGMYKACNLIVRIFLTSLAHVDLERV